MTIEEIEKKLKYIREIAGDDESAHWHQDALHLEFIKYVASLSEQLPELAAKAKLAASTEQIKFSRWWEAARLEAAERAEFARLKAKYEKP